jgi:hypothetical protein
MSDYVNILDNIEEFGQTSKFEDYLLFSDLHTENSKENTNPLYQLQTYAHQNIATLKHVGFSKKRPSVLVHKFKFKGHVCEIYNYLLNSSDLDEINTTCSIKIISLIIKKKGDIRGVINLEYHTFDHKKTHTNIIDYVNKDLNGFYCIYLKKYNNEDLIKIKLELITDICDKQNMVYLLIKYLTHDQVLNIFN